MFDFRTGRVSLFLLLPALALLLAGCHKSIIPEVMHDPDWSHLSTPALVGEKSDLMVTNLTAGVDSLDAELMHQLVLARHPAVKAAEAMVKAAAARNKIAGRWPNPEFESRLMYEDGRRTKFEGGLMFSLPLGGRLGAAGHVSDVDLAIAEAALVEAHKQAILELGSILVTLEGARTRLALNSKLAEHSTAYAELTRTRLAASIADPLDVSLVLADAASDKRALARSRAEVARAETEARLLMGVKDRDLGIRTPRIQATKICSNPDTLRTMAQQHSGSLVRARLEYQRAEWASAQASRERIPDLSVGPAFDIGEEETAVGIAFGLPLPIFNTGNADYKISLAHREAAYEALEYESRAVCSRITIALDRINTLDIALSDLQGEVATATTDAFHLAETRYLAEQLDVLHLLSAHRNYATVQLEIIEMLVARHEALLKLESVIGCPLHDEHLPRQLEVSP